MNTDNMAISGETIDYGPCAFMDAFDPATVFSSIDHGGRYAYGNQPQIAQWNLARLAETLLPLLDADPDAAIAAATDVLQSFPGRYDAYWLRGMRAKLGLADGDADDGAEALVGDLLALLHEGRVDFTSCFRALSASLRGDEARAHALFAEPAAFCAWSDRWREALSRQALDAGAIADAMDRVNPVYVPRNHQVEEALAAATAGDLEPFERLLDVLARPFDERPGPGCLRGTGPAGLRRGVPDVLRDLTGRRRPARSPAACRPDEPEFGLILTLRRRSPDRDGEAPRSVSLEAPLASCPDARRRGVRAHRSSCPRPPRRRARTAPTSPTRPRRRRG